MSTVAIIPARGGSVRVPLKNIIDICGKPAIAYPITACLETGLFDEVVVSTDHDDIARIAEDHGARVVMRGAELSDSVAKVRDVVADFLNQSDHDYGCIVYPTAVLLSADDLVAAHQLLHSPTDADFVLGVSLLQPHPYKALTTEGKWCRPVFGDKIDLKGQEQPDNFAPNGTFHWFKTAAFLAQTDYWQARRAMFAINKLHAFDIDEPEDVEIVRALVQARNAAGG